MCGICGKVISNSNEKIELNNIKKMMEVIHHRGPDDEGIYFSDQVALGHKRLSIIDVNTGKQPICNENKKIWTVFNGEIYNYLELRKYLKSKGHIFKTETDTEVIVHLYEEKGENFISELRGMFSFAIWDDIKKVLMLARDRVGIKPLYYSYSENSVCFASEIKSIIADEYFKKKVNISNIVKFLCYLYPPGSDTMFENIFKLDPGYYLKYEKGKITKKKYWDLEFKSDGFDGNYKEAENELLYLLEETVKCHMLSDVPVGFLLSGGIDSTALLSLATKLTDQNFKTFTIGFEGHDFADERVFGKLAAKTFGSEHYEMTITNNDFIDFVPKYIWHMEEPVCEPPAIALYYISKLAKEHVKVLISGEGADEAFAGYQTYRNLVWLERIKKSVGPFNNSIAKFINWINFDNLEIYKKVQKYSKFLTVPFEDYYLSRQSNIFSLFNTNKYNLYKDVLIENFNWKIIDKPAYKYSANMTGLNKLDQMLYIDTKTWLPDDLLIKADKITMANSIELRVPFLDHKVMEFAASLPANYKFRGLKTKYILKNTLSGLVPNEIINRKKTGFPVPFELWIKNQSKNYVSDILLDQKSINRGYFRKDGLEKMISENTNGMDYSMEIFSLIVLEMWHRVFMDV